MGAINFDQPSSGQVTSDDKALAVTNNGNGFGLFVQSANDAIHGECNGNGVAVIGFAHQNG